MLASLFTVDNSGLGTCGTIKSEGVKKPGLDRVKGQALHYAPVRWEQSHGEMAMRTKVDDGRKKKDGRLGTGFDLFVRWL